MAAGRKILQALLGGVGSFGDELGGQYKRKAISKEELMQQLAKMSVADMMEQQSPKYKSDLETDAVRRKLLEAQTGQIGAADRRRAETVETVKGALESQKAKSDFERQILGKQSSEAASDYTKGLARDQGGSFLEGYQKSLEEDPSVSGRFWKSLTMPARAGASALGAPKYSGKEGGFSLFGPTEEQQAGLAGANRAEILARRGQKTSPQEDFIQSLGGIENAARYMTERGLPLPEMGEEQKGSREGIAVDDFRTYLSQDNLKTLFDTIDELPSEQLNPLLKREVKSVFQGTMSFDEASGPVQQYILQLIQSVTQLSQE